LSEAEAASAWNPKGSNLQIEIAVKPPFAQPVFHKRLLWFDNSGYISKITCPRSRDVGQVPAGAGHCGPQKRPFNLERPFQ